MKSDDHSQPDMLSKQLRGLRSTPADLAAFDAKLRAEIPQQPAITDGWLVRFRRFFNPAWSIATCALIIGIVTFTLVIISGRPAVASTERMAEVYHSTVAGHSGSTHISTIAEARQALSNKWPDVPQLPDEPAGMKPMSCCVHEVGKRQMACINFVYDGQPVILALADAKKVCSPSGTEMTYNNIKYLTGYSEDVNMVMSEQNGTWLCLMGKLPHARLAELTASLRE